MIAKKTPEVFETSGVFGDAEVRSEK